MRRFATKIFESSERVGERDRGGKKEKREKIGRKGKREEKERREKREEGRMNYFSSL